ncbi:hemolysin III family protein [Aurantimonas sp. A2-1-M11]|uniref:PAQR family membrane homeostasis protein TrhA n=1 Tax=Aurantimonas sp. A2-1-M11 TaxID=3113712 RepID=UPI002F95977B
MPDVHPGAVSWTYSVTELRADAAVHAVGVVAALTGAIAFLISMVGEVPAGTFVAVTVYLATLLFSIGVSAAYNVWPVSRIKWMLRRFDHSAIYLLIAGTYTPFLVRSGTWWLLIGVWSIAAVGISLKIVRPGQFDRLSILLYLAMGWSGIVAYDHLSTQLPAQVLWLIVAGGLVYSIGVIFHIMTRLRFQNAIWHAFVVAAAAIHFVAVWDSTLITV